MEKDERWEPRFQGTDPVAHIWKEHNSGVRDGAAQARAHYEPIVAELRARVAELEAQLSRGVFVREMSDEELLWAYWAATRHAGANYPVSVRAVRACIAAATKLPEGAARVTIGGLAVAYGAGGDLQEVLEDEMLDEGCRYAAHIVFVPEPVDSPETAR